jgi:hypothetical protein
MNCHRSCRIASLFNPHQGNLYQDVLILLYAFPAGQSRIVPMGLRGDLSPHYPYQSGT